METKEARERLAALGKPLEFASKNGFSNLHKIKNLDLTVISLVDSLLEGACDDSRALLLEVKEHFTGYDKFPEDEKRGHIKAALALISGKPKTSSRPAKREAKDPPAGISLDSSLQYLKGIGPKIASKLSRMGVKTIEDGLYFFPHRYEDRRNLRKIAQLVPGEVQQVTGEVLLSGEVSFSRGRKLFEVVIGDGTGTLALKWFHYNKKFIKTLYSEGIRILVSGEVKLFGGSREIIHPETEKLEEGEENEADFKKIIPVYPLTEGLQQRLMRKIMSTVAKRFAPSICGAIPEDIQKMRGLADLPEALLQLHLPHMDSDIAELNAKQTLAHRTLVYDEFFFLELGIAMKSHGVEMERGLSIKSEGALKVKLMAELPFELTRAQKRVILEIENDLRGSHPMHRLIQGDVGCGKTIVALIASLHAVEAGYQSAIMAPTEILAEQHFINIHSFAEKLGLQVAVITGSQKNKEKKEALNRIKSGEADIIIGTHAIIQEGVSFHNLGLGIIDEQHRFGVLQRSMLKKMGSGGLSPNILVMTATPIPRSLAMTVYGDLELSLIDELPPGRQTIETKVRHEKEREKVYNLIGKELKAGRQAYVVYPLVEESEKTDLMDATRMKESLSEVFKDYEVGLIHGRMKVDEKEKIMSDFKAGMIDLLVSTTVIEVGIDVPNATIMVIEHAERFGLSQLHQLRGRVGRGEGKSACILLAQYKKSDEARERLAVMESFSSGFDIAEADLKLRGPGDFLGTRQSGMPDFRIGSILKDEKILKEAKEDAFRLVAQDPCLSKPCHSALKEALEKRWEGRLDFFGTG